MEILYEDNHLIAVVKRRGQLTQGDASGDVSLLDEVRQFIKDRDTKPGNVFVGLLHRLDRPVGGVMLFAKTSKGASRISEQIREHRIQKTYQALVEGVPPKQGKVRQWLRKNTKQNFVESFDYPAPGAVPAELSFRTLKTKDDISLVEIKPTTGRPHQIRVAMATLGTPIVGDSKYGAKKPFDGHIALYATGLTFSHPITREPITIEKEPTWHL